MTMTICLVWALHSPLNPCLHRSTVILTQSNQEPSSSWHLHLLYADYHWDCLVFFILIHCYNKWLSKYLISFSTIWRGFWGVAYVADTYLLIIRPGGSHMTPPVSYWLDHITTHRWLPPRTLLWLSTGRLYVYFLIVLPRYISQACWVASSPRLDFFRCTTVLW